MGFDLRDSGFSHPARQDVPEMIGAKIEGLVDGFLERQGRKREDIKGWILHPGGARLLGNVETSSRPMQVRYSAVLGHSRQRGQPLQRHHPLYPSGVARKTAPPARRLCPGCRFRPRFQRGVSASPIGTERSPLSRASAGRSCAASARTTRFQASSEQMVARGAKKIVDPKFRWMVLVHTAVLLGSACEVVFLRRPLISRSRRRDVRSFSRRNAVRWWSFAPWASIGTCKSSTRELGVVTSGPFRFVRHPNYAAVFVEMLALPLIHTAWLTAVAGALAHVVRPGPAAFRRRAGTLGQFDYRAAMAGKPRFLPGMFLNFASEGLYKSMLSRLIALALALLLCSTNVAVAAPPADDPVVYPLSPMSPSSLTASISSTNKNSTSSRQIQRLGSRNPDDPFGPPPHRRQLSL